MTKSQRRDIQSMTGLPMRFQDSFDGQWTDAVGRLHGSRVDLGKIRLVSEGDDRKKR